MVDEKHLSKHLTLGKLDSVRGSGMPYIVRRYIPVLYHV